jgi:hypothetical protein
MSKPGGVQGLILDKIGEKTLGIKKESLIKLSAEDEKLESIKLNMKLSDAEFSFLKEFR